MSQNKKSDVADLLLRLKIKAPELYRHIIAMIKAVLK